MAGTLRFSCGYDFERLSVTSLDGLRRRLNELYCPAPMSEFSDYDEYWERRGALNVLHERWRIAAEIIPDGASVLDVGCGSGDFLRYLRTVRPNIRAKGTDLSARSVEMVQAAGFEAFVVDLAKDDPPGKFDYVTCFEVLEHIADAEAALTRLKGVAIKQIIVSVPNVGYIGSRLRLAVFGRFPITNCVFHINEHVRHWTPKDFADLVKHRGLKIDRQAGQYGIKGLWRHWPSIFAAGMVYVLSASNPTREGPQRVRRRGLPAPEIAALPNG